MTTKTVIVATDGTGTSHAAVDWAAREAERRALPLRIVHAYDGDWRETRFDIGNEYIDVARSLADAVVADARHRAHKIAPQITIETDTVIGHAAPQLLVLSRGAELLVLGSRGRGGFAGLLLGSVSQHLVTRATCPVVVVRADPGRDDRPVAVGVDDSSSAEEVLAAAFEAAAVRGVPLAAVRSFLPSIPLWLTNARPTDVETPKHDAYEHDRLEEQLAPWRRKYPDVPVQVTVTHASVAAALLEVSQRAQLVVVGSHSRGAVSGALLGSTGLQLLHHAHCPVYIARHPSQPGA